MKRAIVSVYDKSGLDRLVPQLLKSEYEIWSSGGTYRHILSLLSVAEQTRLHKIDDEIGFPEILGGRVKTLHPRLYGGILADRENPSHHADMEKNSLNYYDLVVVNLYPFSETVSGGCSEEDAIENIDIGGVSLIRAAAKNYRYISVLVNPEQYDLFVRQLYLRGLDVTTKSEKAVLTGEETLKYRRTLAAQAFRYITRYDRDIANYFNPDVMYREYSRVHDLKYGLNPSQKKAGVYAIEGGEPCYSLLNGNPGYINMIDMIQSWRLVCEVTRLTGYVAVTSFKHTTPTGLAIASSITDEDRSYFRLRDDMNSQVAVAYLRARDVDPLSSFGDFVAVSGVVDYDTAMAIRPEVTDGIIAFGYEPEALEVLKRKKGGKYIILVGKRDEPTESVEYKEYGGNICLVEDTCVSTTGEDDIKKGVCTIKREITTDASINMILANTLLKYTPSNSVAFAYRNMVLGVGAGQQNRVDCVRLAGNKYHNWLLRHHPETVLYRNTLYEARNEAGKRRYKRQTVVNMVYDYVADETNFANRSEYLSEERDGVSVASDGFFPFPDGISVANEYNVKYVVQPGGSVGDPAVIEMADRCGMTMTMTGKRLFFH